MESRAPDRALASEHNEPSRDHAVGVTVQLRRFFWGGWLGALRLVQWNTTVGGVKNPSYELVINPLTIDISPIDHSYWSYEPT